MDIFQNEINECIKSIKILINKNYEFLCQIIENKNNNENNEYLSYIDIENIKNLFHSENFDKYLKYLKIFLYAKHFWININVLMIY